MRIVKGNLKESSYESRDIAMNNSILKKFGKYTLDKIRPLEVQRWMQSQLDVGYSPATINLHLSYLKDLMNKAVELELISINRVLRVRALKNKSKEMEVWKVEELNAFLSTFNLNNEKEFMYYTLFKLLYYSGLRINEALALNKTDIEGANVDVNKIIYMKSKGSWKYTSPKSKYSKRKVSLDCDTLDTLLAWQEMAPYDLLFSIDGDPLSRQTVGYFMKKHADAAGVKRIRVHDLRHSNASFLISLNVNILAISKRLGHKDATQVIETYGHLYPEYQFDIVRNINDFKEVNH